MLGLADFGMLEMTLAADGLVGVTSPPGGLLNDKFDGPASLIGEDMPTSRGVLAGEGGE